MSSKSEVVWVVQMLVNGKWKPESGAATNREAGRLTLDWYRDFSPDFKFRLCPYVPREVKP